MVVTVQGFDQNPDEIAKHCNSLGLSHFHLDIEHASVLKLENLMTNKGTLRTLVGRIEELIKILTEQEETVLVHCQQGLHRTGITAYTLLRMIGGYDDSEEAYEALAEMRAVTYQFVHADRIALAEKYLVQFLMKKQRGAERKAQIMDANVEQRKDNDVIRPEKKKEIDPNSKEAKQLVKMQAL